MKYKNIEVYYDNSAYYGVSLHFWLTDDDKCDLDKFLEDLKYAYKESSWLQQKLNAGDFLDFIDSLSNNSINKELYKNVVENVSFLEDMHHKSHQVGLNEEYEKIVQVNRGSYSDSETVTVFGKLCPLLKNPNDFKEFFEYEIQTRDEILYYGLFNDENYKKRMIEVINRKIENEQKRIDYYENEIRSIKNNISELEIKRETILKIIKGDE